LGWIDVTSILQAFLKGIQSDSSATVVASFVVLSLLSTSHLLTQASLYATGLHQQHERIPDKMLQLMPLLEVEGKAFAKKSLISITGSLNFNLNCRAILHFYDLPFL
jgi:hypothetical protein